MLQPPPRSTGTDTLSPCATLCRSDLAADRPVAAPAGARRRQPLSVLPQRLPRAAGRARAGIPPGIARRPAASAARRRQAAPAAVGLADARDRKSTRLIQSLMRISYAVFCLKKKIISTNTHTE